ncbi:hypothetical protein PV08_06721 [Exophiala spinifera]|uniref:Murein transglycosylase n=1 Tax=Exophiala spinifera TaxID=91928 RepID=A0A0D2B5H7_9EURO|nr:uncharacterized protein PV08_06721 [Exophiala spinifera]KIW13940.1 hypothetical protein PV08_06721 [Exophiala spinifera]
MKVTSVALTAASATVALAQPHNHGHRHFHKHEARDVSTVTSWAPGPTEYAYVLNGQPISAEEVCNGIEDNELKFVDGQDPGVCSSSSASSTWLDWTSSTTASSSSSTTSIPTTTATTTTTTTTTFAASSTPAEFWAAPSSSWSAPSSSSAAGWGSAPASTGGWGSQSSSTPSSGGSGVDSDFPDGTISCSDFPSQYGPVPLSYLGMGGWSGLQDLQIANGLVNTIVTGISGQSCTEGMMCSYACPPGYQKSQWPNNLQGASGQSVGGIQCKGGKLYLTNSALSSKLCIPGVGGVQAQNNANGVVAICRTDYPGTESETVPVELQPGETEALAVPDAGSYYTWQGKSTSAQYYLNPIGYPASQACQWGSPGTPIGNYAPINFGVGAKDGTTWLSIFQNSPTTSAQYQGTVELKGNLSGSCKYSNGQYCGVTGCNSQGCTVSIISGTATYVISN